MSAAEEKFFRGKIVSRREITQDLWSVRIQPGGEFRFSAGQYATLGVQTSSKHFERPYSIASSPYESELEFFFELVPHGELTPQLHKLQAGDTVTVRKAARGRFTLDQESGHTNHLLICTVTGVAPFVSYVRTLYKDWKDGRLTQHRLFLIEAASRSSEFGYREELERCAAEVPWLKCVFTISRPWEDPAWHGEVGRAEDLVRKYSDMWGLAPESTTAYLCGHPNMVENTSGILVRRGWRKEGIRHELYFIPKPQAVSTA